MKSEITEQEAKEIIFDRIWKPLKSIKWMVQHFLKDKYFRIIVLMFVAGGILGLIGAIGFDADLGFLTSANTPYGIILIIAIVLVFLTIPLGQKVKDGFDFNEEGQQFLAKWRETGELPPVPEKKVKQNASK